MVGEEEMDTHHNSNKAIHHNKNIMEMIEVVGECPNQEGAEEEDLCNDLPEMVAEADLTQEVVDKVGDIQTEAQ